MKVLKRFVSGTSAAVIALSSLMTLGFTGVAHAAVQTCTWTGATDLKFSTVTNWSNCNGGQPLAGDIISFPTAPSTSGTVSLTNDLGVALGGVRLGYVTYTSSTGSYKIDTLDLTSGATIGASAQTVCNTYPLQLTVVTISSAGSITDDTGAIAYSTLAVTGNLTLDYGYLGALSGSHVDGNVIITAPVDTTLAGCATGGAGGGAPSGPSINGITVHGLTVQNGASVDLGDTSYPLTLGGGSSTDSPILYFFGNTDTSNNYVATTYSVSSSITLLGNAKINVGELATVNVTGSISGSGFAITRDVNSDASGVLNLSPSSNSSSTPTGLQTNPVTTVTISDSQPTGSFTVVDGETAILDGVRQDVGVNAGGVLKGTGSTQYLFVGKNGTVAPGHSPGTLTVTKRLSMSDGSTYQAELKDTAAGDFDQIIVGDAADTTGNDVQLGNTPTTGATLDLKLYAGYNIKAGDTFMIINNLSKTPVYGIFSGLPEGATFKGPNGSVFKISYVAGDGNDVVLTAITAPTAPNTGLAFVSAHPAVTLGATMLAAGFIFALAKSNSRKLAPARAKSSRRRR